MKEEHIDFLRKQINESVEAYENAISDICVSKSELVSHAETVMIYQKRLIIALQNKLRNTTLSNNIQCERCVNHEPVEDTLIFKNSEDKWFLRTDFDKDEVNGLEEYSYTEIQYCPYCGKKL